VGRRNDQRPLNDFDQKLEGGKGKIGKGRPRPQAQALVRDDGWVSLLRSQKREAPACKAPAFAKDGCGSRRKGRSIARPADSPGRSKDRLLRGLEPRKPLDAGVGFVGPLELDGVVAELLGFPGADVADFAVGVVVPTLAGNGVGDGFAEFVGGRGGKSGEGFESTLATGATGKRHNRVVNAAGGSFVIATEILAGSGRALLHGGAGREEEEVEGIGGGGGEDTRGNLSLDKFLNGGIGDGFSGRGSGKGVGAGENAPPNGFAGDAVFTELVDKGTGEDVIEEIVHLLDEGGVGGIFPEGAPEDREDFDVAEERPVPISELGCGGSGIAGIGMDRNDAQRVAEFGFWGFGGFGFLGFFGNRTCGHCSLLEMADLKIGHHVPPLQSQRET